MSEENNIKAGGVRPPSVRQRAQCVVRLEMMAWSVGFCFCTYNYISQYYLQGKWDDEHLCFGFERVLQTCQFIGLDLVLTALLFSSVYHESICQAIFWLLLKGVETLGNFGISIYCIPYKYSTYSPVNVFYLLYLIFLFVMWILYRIFILYNVFRFKQALDYENNLPEEIPPVVSYRKDSPSYLII